MNLETIGRFLILTAALLFVAGTVLVLMSRLGISRLPGDILLRRGNSTFYFPLMTGIAISIIITVLLNLIFWLRR